MTITINSNTLNMFILFLMTLLAGLDGFDWLKLFDPATSQKIVTGLGLLGIVVKAGALALSKFTVQQTPPVK
jgi:hypothetical protein